MKKDVLIYILIFIIIFMLLLFYLFDRKNIEVQKHLNDIYIKMQLLQDDYKYFINNTSNMTIKKENGFIIIDNFLNEDFFYFLKSQFENKQFNSKNIYFRKGSGIDMYNLHKNNEYIGLLELFYSSEMSDILSKLLKKPIQRPTLSDVNACSLLIYSNKGDYIDWHKDYSNYYGDRYVVLLTLINENHTKTNLSQNEYCYIYNNKEYKMKMKPNTLVIFKGSEILHKSTSIDENEKRILLSMTFCDICQEKKKLHYFLYENIKNLSIY